MESSDTSLWYKQLNNNNATNQFISISNKINNSNNDSILTTSPSSSSSSSFSIANSSSISPPSTLLTHNSKMEFLKNEKQTSQRLQSPHDGSQRSADSNELTSTNSSAQITQPDSPSLSTKIAAAAAAGHALTAASMLRPYGLNFLNTQTPTLNNNIYQFPNNEFNAGLHHQQHHQLQQSGHNQMQSLHGQTISNHHHLHNHQNLMHQQQQQSYQQQQYQLQLQQQQQQIPLMNYSNRGEKNNDDNDEENELISQANTLRNAGCK